MTPKPTTIFKWLRAHKGHPICPKVEKVQWRLRRAKARAYNHDKIALECKDWRERAKHEDWAETLRKVFIPALQDKLNQLIETP